jgi:predicted phage tail protein
MHPRGVQDRYFNSLRNRIKMGTVVSTPTARRASPALRRSSFSRALQETDTNAKRAARHRNQPNLRQRQSDAFPTNVHVSAPHF